jgi:hypothetical protein
MYTNRRKRDRVWPIVAWAFLFGGIAYSLRGFLDRLHSGHKFLPIYNEQGELEGFTHPVLVEAGATIRAAEHKSSKS